jgi:regulator of replication initiation timing
MPQKIFYRAPPRNKPKPAPSIVTVKPHRPWLCPLLVVLTIVGLGVIGWFFYHHGTQAIVHNTQAIIKYSTQEVEESHLELKKHQQENAHLKVQNEQLRTKLAMMVHTTQKGQETYTQVLQTLNQLQKESRDLEEEVNFYQRLLSLAPQKSSKPEEVVIYFTLKFDDESGHYPYKLILTQWAKEAKVAQGTAQIQVLGQSHGKRLFIESITENSSDTLKYSVHYFQRIEGEIQLPKEFIPEQLLIRLMPKGQKKPLNEIRFFWEELLKQEQS